MSDIKTGDPKVRALVQEAVDRGEQIISIAKEYHLDSENDREVALLEAVLPILRTFLTGNAPYNLGQVMGLSSAILTGGI